MPNIYNLRDQSETGKKLSLKYLTFVT